MLSGRVPCMSSGERVALVRNAGHGEDQRALQVLDFNTARVRARREEEREQCENVISTSLYSITNPTVLRADAFLQHDIVSFLPYCCSTKQDVPETVMIGGKWVLEFKRLEVRLSLILSAEQSAPCAARVFPPRRLEAHETSNSAKNMHN
ncbi:hypothetical protein B0F90DRAFT_711693 [Multifurca ochricompacta]|uniref:Uncharacterized protein n=1 Tax=Multifurca ochricompacta TaxID=376703 RepID=A0AAD4QMD2_9AGAM|nr:hypothetical protein B0F90DRAFT_711693 [Multifurca ochricompacta]